MGVSTGDGNITRGRPDSVRDSLANVIDQRQVKSDKVAIENRDLGVIVGQDQRRRRQRRLDTN